MLPTETDLRLTPMSIDDPAGPLTPAHMLRRAQAAIHARTDGSTGYLENGSAVACGCADVGLSYRRYHHRRKGHTGRHH